MPGRYSKRILSYLADPRYQPRQTNKLAADLGISDDEIDDFRLAVEQLVSEGQVVLGSSNAVVLPPPGRERVGTFRLNRRGFGFLVPDSLMEHGDLFIPAGRTGGAMTGDVVRASVSHQPGRAKGSGRSPYTGTIVEVLKRADRRYVGQLMQAGKGWVVKADGNLLTDPVVIRDPHAKDAKPGDKVVVELIEYPSEKAPAEGVITEVLGERGRPDVETLATMRAFGLPDHFPENILQEARDASHAFDDNTVPADREDLTGELICTIDPPDAKDFDDAISIRRLDPSKEPNGAAFELGVHIADVSSFVKQGTELDEHAYARGNSTYLPRKVVPMLPELLSNGVCSLQEGVNRFCKSAFIRFTPEGGVAGQRFANTVIRSAKRLTYLEAQALIEGRPEAEARTHARSETPYPPRLIDHLKLMDELARVLRTHRLKGGMITLSLPDVELVFDDDGHVTDAMPEDESFTHTIIEMFMVQANEAVARHFDSIDMPMIRRIHPDPDVHDIGELHNFARVAGFNIPARPSRSELQALLDAVRGKPAQHAVHMAVLKTLSKAEYAPDLIGHFALASEHYTHFTSPIRRYPDLVVHRALAAYLQAASDQPPTGKNAKKLARDLGDDPRCPDLEALTKIGQHCSATERNSESAERNLRDFLVLQLLSNHLGEDFEGTVTGVTGSGIFVQIDRFLIDGFINIAALPSSGGGRHGDRWRLNRQTGALVAERSGDTIGIGHRFMVRIATVDPPARQLDLVIVSKLGNSGISTAKPKKAKPKQARVKKLRQPQAAKNTSQNSTRPKQSKSRNRKSSHRKGR